MATELSSPNLAGIIIQAIAPIFEGIVEIGLLEHTAAIKTDQSKASFYTLLCYVWKNVAVKGIIALVQLKLALFLFLFSYERLQLKK